ncbi:hypothetical protein [Corynebacterium frankenforstense]|uniref:hypothetical protein n=1 Tax=Corynebacterium frankenforstense TaxID=1230998 RepID=UPI00147413B2|nr:hypothetical protein [Corynebacterium frankenforstense]
MMEFEEFARNFRARADARLRDFEAALEEAKKKTEAPQTSKRRQQRPRSRRGGPVRGILRR